MKTKLLSICALAGFISYAPAQLVVSSNTNAAQLAALLAGTGVTVVSGSEVLNLDNAPTGVGAGTFSGGGPIIGIGSGVILSTGDVLDAPGPNSSGSTTSNNVFSSLKFDFITDTGDLFFNYVFASEEYNEFVGSQFNDRFELRVNGVNIAFIPGTTTPVAINSVNLLSFPEFYNNNDDGAFNLEYDGFTTVFTAFAPSLGAGVNTIEFFITDVGDSALDSAVFIEAGSFSAFTPAIPEPSVVGGLALFALLLVVRFRKNFCRAPSAE